MWYVLGVFLLILPFFNTHENWRPAQVGWSAEHAGWSGCRWWGMDTRRRSGSVKNVIFCIAKYKRYFAPPLCWLLTAELITTLTHSLSLSLSSLFSLSLSVLLRYTTWRVSPTMNPESCWVLKEVIEHPVLFRPPHSKAANLKIVKIGFPTCQVINWSINWNLIHSLTSCIQPLGNNDPNLGELSPDAWQRSRGQSHLFLGMEGCEFNLGGGRGVRELLVPKRLTTSGRSSWRECQPYWNPLSRM